MKTGPHRRTVADGIIRIEHSVFIEEVLGRSHPYSYTAILATNIGC